MQRRKGVRKTAVQSSKLSRNNPLVFIPVSYTLAQEENEMCEEIVYRVALTMIPAIGPVQAKILVDPFHEAASIFTANLTQLRKVNGLGEIRAKAITSYRDFT